MSSQARPPQPQPPPFHHMHLHNSSSGGSVGDNNNNNKMMMMMMMETTTTTYTKLFVGGLAWETKRDTMRHYFEQFGEIQEAVVITDKNTGRSKGYGFVTFKDPEAAMRACQNPAPVIDGRRANCNLAAFGAHKTPLSLHGRFRAGSALLGPSAYQASPSTYFHQPTAQYTSAAIQYSPYGYSTGYTQDTMYPMSYYGVYGGGQQYSPYYTTGASGAGSPGVYTNYYPYYAQYTQATQGQAIGVQYPFQYHHYLPQRCASPGIVLSLPPSTLTTTSSDTINVSSRAQSAGVTVAATTAAASQVTRIVSGQSSSN